MGKSNFKAVSLFVVGLLISASFAFSNSNNYGKRMAIAEASNTGADIRISVVRPVFWDDAGAYQTLRIANSSSDLDSKTNVTYVTMSDYVDSGYYSSSNSSPSFTEYDTDGIIFYDVPLATISGKYFDLARLSSTDTATADVWTSTPNETFTVGLNNSIWRIFNNAGGIYRPLGTSAESRAITNQAVGSILYGYFTCSSNESNGFEAYASLRDNFDLEGRTYLDTDVLTDYEYYANYSTNRTGISVKIADKVAAMKLAYEAVHTPEAYNFETFVDSKKLLSIVLLISLVSLSTLAGYGILFRKKKTA